MSRGATKRNASIAFWQNVPVKLCGSTNCKQWRCNANEEYIIVYLGPEVRAKCLHRTMYQIYRTAWLDFTNWIIEVTEYERKNTNREIFWRNTSTNITKSTRLYSVSTTSVRIRILLTNGKEIFSNNSLHFSQILFNAIKFILKFVQELTSIFILIDTSECEYFSNETHRNWIIYNSSNRLYSYSLEGKRRLGKYRSIVFIIASIVEK